MGKAEYIVLGAWAVQIKTGKIRHKPCRRWCDFYNETDDARHYCDTIEDMREEQEVKYIPIPAMVLTVAECIRNKPNASV